MASMIRLLIFFGLSVNAVACTFFNKTINNTTLIGYNEDFYCESTHVVFYPAQNNEFARVFFGCNGVDFSGINEKGLFVGEAILTERQINFPPDKPFFPGYIWYAILEQCASIKEALTLINEYNIESLQQSHFFLVDRSGASIVVEWGKEKLEIIEKTGDYQLVTNFTLSDPSLAGWYPCPRYEMAEKMVVTPQFSVAHFTKILDKVHSEDPQEPTQYSVILNITEGIIYMYYKYNYDKVKIFNIEGELNQGYHFYDLHRLFNNAVIFPNSADPMKSSLGNLQIYLHPNDLTANIHFHLDQEGWTNIGLYTLTGKRIHTLVEGISGSGDHHLVFNPGSLASGAYFLQILTPNHSQTMKIDFAQ